jgi:hypothetical protein
MSATFDRRHDATGRRWLSLILAAGIATTTATGAPAVDTPPHPARWEVIEGPRVPVAGAAAVSLERGPALIGGFTDRLEATAAVQFRDPRHGWMPVGGSLLEPRAEATAIRLPDGTVLVVGGWSGRLPDAVRPLGTAERIDPWNPASRRTVPPPFADRDGKGLDGHAACPLPDGRVLLVHDRRGTIFDPESDTWTRPFRLTAERRSAALIPMTHPSTGETNVVVIGGATRDDDPAVETIRVDAEDGPTSEPWPVASIPPTLTRAAAIQCGGSIVIAGGELRGRSVSATWRLDPDARTLETGPPLPVADGVTGGRLISVGTRLVLLGGESIIDHRPVPVPCGAVLHPRLARIWALPAAPASGVRGAVLKTERGPELIGGYLFDPSAPRGARIRILGDDLRLRLPSLMIDD